MGSIEVITLTDGGQPAEQTARRIAGFLEPAKKSIELALYDVRLPDPTGSIIADQLREAQARGVSVRLLYNVDSGRPSELHPPPRTRPDILAELPIDAIPVPGVPDLMHHKYAVRDGQAVLTGSANWTVDSWTRQENVLAIVEDPEVASRFEANFEELWSKQDVGRSGKVKPEPVEVGKARVTAWFTPGQGERLSHRIAQAIGSARRVRIASPVITSGPILGTLAEAAGRGGRDVAGIVDGPQTTTIFHQWRENGHTAWKIPLLAAVLGKLPFSAKPSTPWTPELEVHDFMHCKLTVADDIVFLGSFNLSRSGEQNAESVLEISGDDELADRLADFVDGIRGRYPAAQIPEQSRDMTSSTPSASSA